MGHNKATDRDFFIAGGSVKTSGGSKNLGKGQFAVVDVRSSIAGEGPKIVSAFAGKNKKDRRYVLSEGVANLPATRSHSNKAKQSVVFALNEIVGLRVSAPKQTEQIVDEFTLGYNGIDADTSFDFKTGDSNFRVSIGLSGDALSYLGIGVADQIVNVDVEIPSCNSLDTCTTCDNCDAVDCKSITEEIVDRLKNTTVASDVLLGSLLDITPVASCTNDVTAALIPYDYYTLEVCDTGTDNALALVQAQYDVPVIRIDRKGATSVYQILLLQDDGAPDDYSQSIPSIIKGCDTCPAGYTAVAGGLLYAFTIEDDGADQSALITALPGYASATVKKADGQLNGVGFYTAVFTDALTDAEIAAFVGGAAPRNTATVTLAGEVAAICSDSTTNDTAWTLGDTCNAVEEQYEITLPDNNCGDNRLAELQSIFPTLNIIVKQENTANSKRTVTLTGTSGTANITVNGTAYLATFATSLTVTASNFVTAHAAAILADCGMIVTAANGVLTFTDATTGFATVTAAVNATGNLAGTLGAITVITQDVTGGCKTKYVATVLSNIVCDECDPIYKAFYETSAPESYDGHAWSLIAGSGATPSGDCLCGIRVKSKAFVINPSEPLRGQLGFIETSLRINGSAGYPVETALGIGRIPQGQYSADFISYFSPRTHLGGNLIDKEIESNFYFKGDATRNYLTQVLHKETSNIEDLMAQYIQYTVSVSRRNHTGGFMSVGFDEINYNIFVEVGKHTSLENLLNDLASNAGVEPVQAFGI